MNKTGTFIVNMIPCEVGFTPADTLNSTIWFPIPLLEDRVSHPARFTDQFYWWRLRHLYDKRKHHHRITRSWPTSKPEEDNSWTSTTVCRFSWWIGNSSRGGIRCTLPIVSLRQFVDQEIGSPGHWRSFFMFDCSHKGTFQFWWSS